MVITRIRKDLNEVVGVHIGVINSLKAQKVRMDKMFDQYSGQVKKEFLDPSNKYLRVAAMIDPFIESVITSKLMDFELLKHYDKCVSEMIKFESGNCLSNADIDEVEYNFDRIVDKALVLENKVMDQRLANYNNIVKLKQHEILLYSQIEDKHGEGYCKHCGIELKSEDSNSCDDCDRIPESLKKALPSFGEESEEESYEEDNDIEEAKEQIAEARADLSEPDKEEEQVEPETVEEERDVLKEEADEAAADILETEKEEQKKIEIPKPVDDYKPPEPKPLPNWVAHENDPKPGYKMKCPDCGHDWYYNGIHIENPTYPAKCPKCKKSSTIRKFLVR